VALDGCVRGESAHRLGFGREAKKTVQGQTLKMVGIFLPKPVFTHGQLYVAMLRIGCFEGVKLLVTDGWEDAHENALAGVYTHNVVYTEVL